jgi:hypothetical protein
MAKYKHASRTKPQPRAGSTLRKRKEQASSIGDVFAESDGIVERELEFDTSKCFMPLRED